MSTSTGGVRAQQRRNSRKVSSRNLKGHAAIACLVLGCCYTVYSNILGASVYPSVNSAVYEAPVVKRSSSSNARSIPPSTLINDVFAEYPDAASAIERPVSVAATSSIMFNERFAAYAAQS